MNISLTPELEEFVSKKVDGGMYHTASEVIREGLRLLQERDELREHRLEALRREVAIGLEQLANGQSVTAEEVFDEIRRRSRERRRKTA